MDFGKWFWFGGDLHVCWWWNGSDWWRFWITESAYIFATVQILPFYPKLIQSKTKQPGQTQFYSQIGRYSNTYSSTILLWKIKRMKYAIVDCFYSIISKVELFLFTLGLFLASWREGLPVKIKTTQRNGTLAIYKVYLTKVLKFINI